MGLISGERTGLRQVQARAWFRTREPASQARVLDQSQQENEFERLPGCLTVVAAVGRMIARGRDATDVAIATTFGPNTHAGFKVWTDEVLEA